MRVIVCGAGRVGLHIARSLAAEAEVTLVDSSADRLASLDEQLEVHTVEGQASYPDILYQAGGESADMIIAVTDSDEVNMIACQVAYSLYRIPTKIARIRSQSYLRPDVAGMFSRDHMPIDFIISPEIETARSIAQRLEVPGAFDMVHLAQGAMRGVSVLCKDTCKLVNTPLRQLTASFPDLLLSVVGITRNGKLIVPGGDAHMQVGDEVYFVVSTEHLTRAMILFGYQEQAPHRMVIVGGSETAVSLAQQLEHHPSGLSVHLLEIDFLKATTIARDLQRTIVLRGDGLDAEILKEAKIDSAETLLAATGDDETNILIALLAKRYGCRRTIAILNRSSYAPLVVTLGVDVVVSPQAITISRILYHIRRGKIVSLFKLRDGSAEIIEAVALETSSFINTRLRDMNLPDGVIIGAIIRRGEIILPRGDSVIRAGDRVIMLVASQQIRKVEKLLSVRLSFF